MPKLDTSIRVRVDGDEVVTRSHEDSRRVAPRGLTGLLSQLGA
jgi:hypothetical protein